MIHAGHRHSAQLRESYSQHRHTSIQQIIIDDHAADPATSLGSATAFDFARRHARIACRYPHAYYPAGPLDALGMLTGSLFDGLVAMNGSHPSQTPFHNRRLVCFHLQSPCTVTSLQGLACPRNLRDRDHLPSRLW